MSNSQSGKSVKEQIQMRQKKAIWLLYGAALLKAIAVFLPVFEFPSGVLLFIFFFLEIFLLPPIGMAVMCLVTSALFFFLPNIVQLLVGLFIGSMLVLCLGLAATALFSGIVLTFVNGVLMDIEIIATTGPTAIGLGVTGAVVGLGAATGAGVHSAVSRAARNTRFSTGTRKRIALVGSLLTFAVIGWPTLSYSQAISGALACKPAVILGQDHLNRLNWNASQENKALFEDEESRFFGSGFYSDYINNGNNNLSQGEKTMAAGNDSYFAVLIDGMLYVQSPEMNHMYYGAGYIPRKTDALILAGGRTFIFGYNRVFCADGSGNYTWNKTKWTSEFEALTSDEQFERVYDILERQNTEQDVRFSYEEVGAVAYAQRNGLLLSYDAENHSALFARQDDAGNVTVYLQNSPNQRSEQVTFTPNRSTDGLTYVMMENQGILYLKENRVMFLDQNNNWAENSHFTNPDHGGETHDLIAIAYFDRGDEGIYTIYLDEKDKIGIDSSLIGIVKVNQYNIRADDTRVLASAGKYIYSVQYDNSLLSRLTYIKDVKGIKEKSKTSGWDIASIWMEDWSYQRIALNKSLFIPEEESEPEETDFESQYPAPTLKKWNYSSNPYDPTYIAASVYSSYVGPQDFFWFKYPSSLYDNVEYIVENDGADVTIKFTRQNDSSSLEISVHPLPEGVEDIQAYAKSWCENEKKALYNSLEVSYKEYADDDVYRFRLRGWTEMNSNVGCYVNCHADENNIMKMVLKYPVGTDSEDKKVKEFYADIMNYHCGFGIPSKQPVLK